MIALRPYYTAFRRLKRSKGFGIHSPFSFYFVTRVLCERSPYYAYANIKQTRRKAMSLAVMSIRRRRVISLKNARMLFRIVCHLAPRHILQIGTSYGVSTTAMLEVSSVSQLHIYTGDNPHDDIYRQVTAPYAKRIHRLPSLAAAVDSYGNVLGNDAPFLLVNSLAETDAATVKSCVDGYLARGGTVVMRNIARSGVMRQLWQETVAAMDHGVSFTNERLGIVVGMRHLPMQHINLWF